MPKDRRGGKQVHNRLKLDIQLFAAKRSGITLPRKQYRKIISEIDDNYYFRYNKKGVFIHYSGDYAYKVKNYGFNNYVIVSKEKIR